MLATESQIGKERIGASPKQTRHGSELQNESYELEFIALFSSLCLVPVPLLRCEFCAIKITKRALEGNFGEPGCDHSPVKCQNSKKSQNDDDGGKIGPKNV